MASLPVSSSTYTLEDQARMTQARNYFAWQARLVLPHVGPRVVEVGCGIGNFTANLLDRDAVFAVDVEPGCLSLLESRFPAHPALHVSLCDPTSPEFLRLSRHRLDSCVCLNVLEHIEHDAHALHNMASVLQPGGTVVLLLPAFPALTGPIDRHLHHYRRYTRRQVIALASAAGLRIDRLHYVNAVGFFGWWANAHLFRREAQAPDQIALFDRWIVPWLSRAEAIAPPPFGQSLFAVLRKS